MRNERFYESGCWAIITRSSTNLVDVNGVSFHNVSWAQVYNSTLTLGICICVRARNI